MDVSVQDILSQLNDYLANYSASSVDSGQKLRAINRSIEYIKRRFGLPCDEIIQTFWYDDDVPFTALNADFDESIFLGYHATSYNNDTRPWEYRVYPEIIQMMGNLSCERFYGITSMNGSKQIVMIGNNRLGSVITDPLTTVGAWSATGDASNLTTDSNNNVQVGSSSLSFTMTRNTGSGGIQNTSLNWNIFNLIKYGGLIKFFTQLAPPDNITSISLILSSDTAFMNTYTITVTDDAIGNSFQQNSDKISFPMSDAVIAGSPNPNLILSAKIIWNTGPSYTNGIIWANDLYFSYPDQMDLIYYTQNKGTDSLEETTKIILTQPSDIVTIGSQYPDFIDMIAMRAAINCYPSVLGDPNFYQAYMAQWNDILRVWGRVFPRKRTQNGSYGTVLQRNG